MLEPDVVIVPAQRRDLHHVAANLRPEHIREVNGMLNLSPYDAVMVSVADSAYVFAGRADGEALFLCGASKKRLLSDFSSVWMLATPDIDRHPLAAAEALRRLFAQAHVLAEADVLEQWIPHWYRKGLKWLLWLGWRADGMKEINGVPHIRMVHENVS
ncbi:MAG: hypothetical protein LUC93_04735 [Planctomycetaceae bacterium]|nr:hypothetical protein [Planctomycetaceae bacterium]